MAAFLQSGASVQSLLKGGALKLDGAEAAASPRSPEPPAANDLWSEADDGRDRSPSPPPAASVPRELGAPSASASVSRDLFAQTQPIAIPPSSTTSEVGDGTEVRAFELRGVFLRHTAH